MALSILQGCGRLRRVVGASWAASGCVRGCVLLVFETLKQGALEKSTKPEGECCRLVP